MVQIYGAIVESRNVCKLLGLKVKDRLPQQETTRRSQVWSSRTVTPTQPKAPENRRMRGATILRSMASSTGLRAMPPPPVPLSANVSRTNTMTSISSATPRSHESFSTIATSVSRTNTTRSVTDEGEEQFDRIFLKLQATSNLATQALPHCRTEFQARKSQAQNSGQDRLAHQWARALNKCEEVIGTNKLLKKRLEVVKVNDPGLRYQRDFWQLCDSFVQVSSPTTTNIGYANASAKSWTDLATEIKDINAQKIDTTTIRQVMRNVQRHVKDVSKTISHSTLYHQALGIKDPNSAGPHSIAAAFSSGVSSAYGSPSTSTSGSHSGYVTPVPATPLSAALGPAAQATVANTPSVTSGQREYFQEPTTSRAVRDRNDTPMQPQGYPRRH